MRFGLLGTLEVRDAAGRPLDVGAAKPRALLTLLLAERGRVVPLDRIAADPVFHLSRAEIDSIIKNSRFTGLAQQQTEAYLAQVRALLSQNADTLRAFEDTAITV